MWLFLSICTNHVIAFLYSSWFFVIDCYFRVYFHLFVFRLYLVTQKCHSSFSIKNSFKHFPCYFQHTPWLKLVLIPMVVWVRNSLWRSLNDLNTFPFSIFKNNLPTSFVLGDTQFSLLIYLLCPWKKYQILICLDIPGQELIHFSPSLLHFGCLGTLCCSLLYITFHTQNN